MVELVDTLDLKSNDHCGRAGSSPASSTIALVNQLIFKGFLFNSHYSCQPFANHLLKGLYLQPLERLLFLIFHPLTLNRSNMENYKHYSILKKTLKELLDSHNNLVL